MISFNLRYQTDFITWNGRIRNDNISFGCANFSFLWRIRTAISLKSIDSSTSLSNGEITFKYSYQAVNNPFYLKDKPFRLPFEIRTICLVK